jgi:hypothetical protein
MGRACSTNGAKRNACRILVGKPEGREHQEDLDIDGRLILRWFLGRMGWYELD